MEIRNTLPREQATLIAEKQEEIMAKFENYIVEFEHIPKESTAYRFSTVSLFPEGIEKIKQLTSERNRNKESEPPHFQEAKPNALQEAQIGPSQLSEAGHEQLPQAVEKAPQKSVADYLKDKDIAGLSLHMKEGLAAYRHSDTYKNYLSFVSTFHRYSYANIRMIQIQKPGASLIAGFQKWAKDYERHVKKGEKAIKILAPARYKVKDEQGNPKLDENGQEIERLSFRGVSVFDVSQTEGKALPQSLYNLEGDVKGYQDLFVALKRTTDAEVRVGDFPVNGAFYPGDNRIELAKGMSEAQTIKTFIHELTHRELHADSKAHFGDPTYSQHEFEAESVAYVLSQHFGLDTSAYSFGYLASWGLDQLSLERLEATMKTVQKTANEMIQKVDEQLQKGLDKTPEKSALQEAIAQAKKAQKENKMAVPRTPEEVPQQGEAFAPLSGA